MPIATSRGSKKIEIAEPGKLSYGDIHASSTAVRPARAFPKLLVILPHQSISTVPRAQPVEHNSPDLHAVHPGNGVLSNQIGAGYAKPTALFIQLRLKRSGGSIVELSRQAAGRDFNSMM